MGTGLTAAAAIRGDGKVNSRARWIGQSWCLASIRGASARLHPTACHSMTKQAIVATAPYRGSIDDLDRRSDASVLKLLLFGSKIIGDRGQYIRETRQRE